VPAHGVAIDPQVRAAALEPEAAELVSDVLLRPPAPFSFLLEWRAIHAQKVSTAGFRAYGSYDLRGR